MKKVLPFSGKFPHKLFSIVAIIALVAFLLTLDPVAKIVKKGVEALGVTFPVMEVFKNVAANILLVALGYLALTIAALILVPIVKIAVTLAAVAIVGVGLYNLYNTFTGRATRYLLPMKGDGIKAKQNGNGGYGDTDLSKK
jgi:hypothetical protein